MERCPVCQAKVKQDPACPRCKTDLARLLAIEAEASRWLMQAIGELAAGEDAKALHAVESSLRLKREFLAVRLRGFLTHRLSLSFKYSDGRHTPSA